MSKATTTDTDFSSSKGSEKSRISTPSPQRTSGHMETRTRTSFDFTDEEYANFLKVSNQINAATPEILDGPSLELLLPLALNVVRKASLSKQWIALSVSCWNGTTSDPKIIAVLKSKRDDAHHYDAETSRLDLVQEVWEFKIIPFFNVKELALLRPTCKWCDEQWQEFLKRNTFRVPEQVPTIDEAMRIGFNLSIQKVYSKEKSLVVVLSEGEHVVEGSFTASWGTMYENILESTCSNISFVGQGKDKTTVRGGIVVRNKKNVTVKSLTLTNPPNGYGLVVRGEEASVEMLNVSVKGCGYGGGLRVSSAASVKATQCEFSENEYGVSMFGGSKGIFTDCFFDHNGSSMDDGLVADDKGTLVELRGEQTEIHHNGRYGLSASSNATINIYIPSRSITALVHDNDDEDLVTYDGGKIQSQLSSSSLELTVIQEAPPASDDEDEDDY